MKRLAILLLLLATTTNGFVAQTHLHAGLAAQHQAATASDPGAPVGSDESRCLLCQVAAHGGAALASHHALSLQEARQYVVAIPGLISDPVSLPPTHAWLSRGPPRS